MIPSLTVPGVEVWLMSGYALLLLAVAFGLDHLGDRSAQRSSSWRTGSFVYHEDNDAWKCHEDQWLWPASFDPEKRVLRYEGQHTICGRCPSKSECSPSPGPREITRAIDPWPHSETGRFHRGIAVSVAAAGLMLTLGTMISNHGLGDLMLLGVVTAALATGTWRLWHGLLDRPSNFPDHVPHEVGGQVVRRATAEAPAGPVPVELGMPRVRYASQRRAAERQTAAASAAAGTTPSPAGAAGVVPSEADIEAAVDRYQTRWGLGAARNEK